MAGGAGGERHAARGALGRHAEELAARYLEQQGLEIVCRNWRRPEGELDIVALDRDGTCVFCEVRSRSGDQTGSALEAIDPRKRAQVIRTARLYLAAGEAPPRTTGFRFDVLAVTFRDEAPAEPEVVHIPRAFETAD